MTQRSILFKLDLRIDKKIIKLKVHQEDTLTDLIERLSKAITWKNISKDKIKSRLEDQFTKILGQDQLSTTVKNKLNQLVEQSKIVIVNIQTTKNDPILNQTPFRILQDSLSYHKKQDQKPNKKQFHYLEDLSPTTPTNINNKYQMPHSYSKQGTLSANYFQNIRLQSLNQGMQREEEIHQVEKQQSSTSFFSRKYEALDRKCDQFIRKHDQLSENYNKYKMSQNIYDLEYDRPQEEKRIVKNYTHHNREQQYEELIRNNQERIHHQRIPLLNTNQNRLNRNYNVYLPPDLDSKAQTFYDYKNNRYKSQNNISRKQLKPQYANPTSSHRVIAPSRSLTKINYQKQNGVPLSRDYGANYSQGLTMKGGHQVHKKFNYI